MDRLINRQQTVRLVCPQCGCLMEPAERGARPPVSNVPPKVGQLRLVPRSVPVWRCGECGIDRPRL